MPTYPISARSRSNLSKALAHSLSRIHLLFTPFFLTESSHETLSLPIRLGCADLDITFHIHPECIGVLINGHKRTWPLHGTILDKHRLAIQRDDDSGVIVTFPKGIPRVLGERLKEPREKRTEPRKVSNLKNLIAMMDDGDWNGFTS